MLMRFSVARRHRKLLAVLRFEESVRQRDRIDHFHLWVSHKLGIDVEEHRHVHLKYDRRIFEIKRIHYRLSALSAFTCLFVRIQLLFLETKALDLVKVGAGLEGNHVVSADPDDWQIRGVFGRVEGQCRFAGNYLFV